MTRFSLCAFGLTVLLAVLFLSGCENSITPYSGRATYSVYGGLGLHRSQQWVRIKKLRQPIRSDSATPLPASATITELPTGHRWTLQDSLFQISENTFAHNYWANVDLKPRTEYQLTVTGEAGTTRATTQTPTNTVATIDPSRSTPGPPTDTVHVLSDSVHCLTEFKVTFRDAKVPYEASVGFRYQDQMHWISADNALTPGDNETETLTVYPEAVLGRFIDPVNDPETCQYYEPRCGKLSSGTFKIAYTYISPDWFGNRPSGNEGFDPRNISTVRNGIGFLGGYFRDTLSVTVSRGVIDQRLCNCKIFGCQD